MRSVPATIRRTVFAISAVRTPPSEARPGELHSAGALHAFRQLGYYVGSPFERSSHRRVEDRGQLALIVGRNKVAPHDGVQREGSGEGAQRDQNDDGAMLERPLQHAPIGAVSPPEKKALLRCVDAPRRGAACSCFT